MLQMVVTSMPIIISSIVNTFFLKTPMFRSFDIPMDNGHTLDDRKRLFGENKTWRGFVGMCFFSSLCMILWGQIAKINPFIQENTLLYVYHRNTITYNMIIGGALGLSYGVFELPNSFLKRRIGIKPGKSTRGVIGIFFVILDQIDSLFGCVFIISLIYPMTIKYYLTYVFLGGLIHIILSSIFYFLKIRKNF